MQLLDEIHAHLKTLGYTEEDIEFLDSASVYVAQEIAMYAHRNQKRVNGDNYFAHPYSVLQKYRKLVGIKEGDYFCMSEDLMGECALPYRGVQELCLLHDVVEDGHLTIEDVEAVFTHLSLGSFFKACIKEQLLLLTHREEDDYFTYLCKILKSPGASMVKLMDLSDNMNPSTLTVLGEKELKRICDYAMYARLINDTWHFLENAEKYRKLKG